MNDKNRKDYPMYRGLMKYFPLALAEVAKVSKVANEKHNPGEPLHWSRNKSSDHLDCAIRHITEAGKPDVDGMSHTAHAAWRILAQLQIELEEAEKDNEAVRGLAVELEMYKADGIPLVVDLCEHEPIKQFDKAMRRGRCYIAGPMRGIKYFNFPAFDAAKAKLEREGWKVISPADLDRRQGYTDNKGYARRDTAAILTCDAIYLLKGWENSVGATAEYFLARWIGLDIITQTGDSDPLHSFALKHVVP